VNKDVTREREEKWVGNAAVNIRINKCKSVRRGHARARAGLLHVQSGRNKCKSRFSENGTPSNKIFERYFGARQRKNGSLTAAVAGAGNRNSSGGSRAVVMLAVLRVW